MSDEQESRNGAVVVEGRRRRLMESPRFLEAVEEMLRGLDLDRFDEEWQAVTIVNEAKERVLGVVQDGDDPAEARARLVAFYERKRRFFEAAADDPAGDVGPG